MRLTDLARAKCILSERREDLAAYGVGSDGPQCPYVQRKVILRRKPEDSERQVYTAGSNRPAGAKVRSPVAWMAGGMEAELWEVIDETIFGMGASCRVAMNLKT